MIVPNHRERQLMQYLRGGGWVKASTLPPGPRLIEGLLLKGWIEQQDVAGEIYYRMTEAGLTAKMARVRISN